MDVQPRCKPLRGSEFIIDFDTGPRAPPLCLEPPMRYAQSKFATLEMAQIRSPRCALTQYVPTPLTVLKQEREGGCKGRLKGGRRE